MPVGFGDYVLAERQPHVLRMGHRHHAGRVDGIELVDHREDRVELDANFLRLRGIDFDAREMRDALDVGGGERHGGGGLLRQADRFRRGRNRAPGGPATTCGGRPPIRAAGGRRADSRQFSVRNQCIGVA